MSSSVLWYLSRSTGMVLLVLLSFTAVLGILIHSRARVQWLPSFAVTGLHRNASLLAVVLLVIHVATAVLDPFVSISWLSVVVPFTSHYEPVWMGLGALSLDIMLAVVVTSLLRERIGHRTWRAVHVLNYAMYPLAVVHGIGAASDLQSGVLLLISVVCVAAVAGAAGWRLVDALRHVPPRRRVVVQLAAAEAVGTRR
ncbi:MAG TPA: ferric reductase-like transmembrane domain-containing protein [Mycobacteriales bacterium]|jgi:sulfoxide reductase heme-binding subunit YedZ|nr:ferric reductase-like transmembrane domain-containing protein [Mycobacteriales bacterium]